MNWFNNLKIVNKIIFIAVLISVLFSIEGLIDYYYNKKTAQMMQSVYKNNLLPIDWLSQISILSNANNTDLLEIIIQDKLSEKIKLIKAINKRQTKKDRYLAIFQKSYLDSYEKEKLPELLSALKERREFYAEISQMAMANTSIEEAYEYFQSGKEDFKRFGNLLRELIVYNENLADATQEENTKNTAFANNLILGLLIFTLSTSIIIGYKIAHQIADPLILVIHKIREFAGGNFSIEPIAVKSKDETGELAYAFNIMSQNIRDLMQTRETFLATLTHDLRSPIISEQKALETILDKKLGTSLDDFSEYLADIYKTNQELLRIVNNILSVYHYEEGKFELKLQDVNLAEIIESSVSSMKSLAKDHKSEIKTIIEPDLPPVFADRDEILRVINNLLSNAIKHNAKDTSINISAKKINNDVQVAIQDNGKGIPEQERPNIFQRYPATKRKLGTGLGLYLSRQIVDAHKGRIWFETQQDEGTIFYFTLPIA